MLVASRTLLRLSKQQKSLPSYLARAAYSTSSAQSDDYHSLDDQLFYEVSNPVAFDGDKAAIFDATSIKERRFVPFELKELSFKCGMGFMGSMVWGYMYNLGIYSEVAAAAFVLNWAYKSVSIMSSTVRKIELHKDGKTVTVTPRIGQPWACKIADVRKL